MSDINKRSWFVAKATKDGGAEIAIYDEIGMWGITAKDFFDDLKALGDVSHIALHINSPGGEVFAGISIYNMLARHKAEITVTIDGIAASIASLVAMAGDTIIMPENAMMMIHDPSGVVIGTSKDMREIAAALDKMKQAMIAAYAAKSGKDRGEIADIMSDETWFSAQEAVDAGFADEIEQPVKIAANFDLTKFRNAPSSDGRKPRGRAAHSPEESSMTEAEKAAADKLAAEQKAKTEAEAKAKTEADAKAKTEADAKAKADADAARANGSETPDQIRARVEAEVKARHEEIVALCKLAGVPARAVDYIAANKSAAEVRADLLTLKASDKKDISARNRGDGAEPPATADLKPADIYANRAKARAHA